MAEKKKICGIVMPISPSGDLEANHWTDVKSIIEDACTNAGFETRLVSDTFESNLIHKEILQNIYKDDIIVVDVSTRNPNVFFELGIRMATQKPTVIVKDNQTTYPFDTGPNRYIEYPRDLRHPEMEKFKSLLTKALQKTIEQGPENSFIGQLGPFQIPEVESKEAPISELLLDRLDSLERRLKTTQSNSAKVTTWDYTLKKSPLRIQQINDKQIALVSAGLDENSLHECIRQFSASEANKGLGLHWNLKRINDYEFEVILNSETPFDPDAVRTLRNIFDNYIPF